MRNVRGIVHLIELEHPVGARGGGCDHLYCSHPEGLVGILADGGKGAGGDPPLLICGGGGRGGWPIVITSSDVEPIQ